jgi:hypothetical protein
MLRGGTEVDEHCDKCKNFLFHGEGMNGLEPWIGKWIHRDRKVCGICDVCEEPLLPGEGRYGFGDRETWWVHTNIRLCRQIAADKLAAKKQREQIEKEAQIIAAQKAKLQAEREERVFKRVKEMQQRGIKTRQLGIKSPYRKEIAQKRSRMAKAREENAREENAREENAELAQRVLKRIKEARQRDIRARAREDIYRTINPFNKIQKREGKVSNYYERKRKISRYYDESKNKLAKQEVLSEMQSETERFNALSVPEQLAETQGDFFPFPFPINDQQTDIIFREKINRANFKKREDNLRNKTIKNIQYLYPSTARMTIVYSVDSINKTDPKRSNPYSIEIHCTSFRPEHNVNDPPQNFYGHVTLIIYRSKTPDGTGIYHQTYHYGVMMIDEKEKIQDFTRKFWTKKTQVITKPTEFLLDVNAENQHLAFLFPNISAGDLMIKYYNWCIRTCPTNQTPYNLGSVKSLTRWGHE